MLWWNLTQPDNWRLVLATVGIFPVLAIAKFRRLPTILRSSIVAIIPIYFLVHFSAVFVSESRYFIMPMAVALIPSVLWMVVRDGFAHAGAVERG
jgi:hypothetical protein